MTHPPASAEAKLRLRAGRPQGSGPSAEGSVPQVGGRAARAAVSRGRRAMLGKIHIAAKDLGLTEESYRDLLERQTGKRSAADCGDGDLDRVLAEFARLGWKPKHKGNHRRARKEPAPAVRPMVAKMRALWHALFNLGELRDASDKALAAFVKRQTDIEALEWMTPDQAYKVIEALKAWCGRAGFEVPKGGLEAKRALLGAQWKKLDDLGALRIPDLHALDAWLVRLGVGSAEPANPEPGKVSPHATAVSLLDAGKCDDAADRLGRWIRKAKREVDG